MRAIALAAIIGGTVWAGVATAETWTDPTGNVVFEKPNGWRVEPQRASSGTIVLAFDGSHDCYIMASPNATTAAATPRQVVRSTTAAFTQTVWETTASAVNTLFPEGAHMTSQSVDTSGAWPVQRAEFQGAEGPIYGAIQSRPGMDLMAFCAAYGSSTAPFDGLFNSISHPNDATWEAALAADAAAAAAAAAAQPPAPAPQQ